VSGGIFEHWPNRITALRFLGAMALFVVLAFWSLRASDDPDWAATVCFWMFIATAATDALDGYLARRDGHVTAFGRVADSFVDKVLVIGVMTYLGAMEWSRGYLPIWVVVIVTAREFLVTGIRGYVESLGKEFGADWFGKIKMIVQCIAISALFGIGALRFLPEGLHGLLGGLAHVCVWATVVTALGSGVNYVLRCKRLLDS
jgi:CDP-diacylglycerol--glycerol-3-phosphate 3-phosphatidyltransferase